MNSCKLFVCAIALVTFLAACTPAPTPTMQTATPLPLPLATLTPTAHVTVTMAAPMAASTATPIPSPTLTPSATVAPTATPAKIQHTVYPTDTLLGLAKQYHVSMAAIQLANNMGEGNILRDGRVLDIPTGPQWDGESPYWLVHIVQSGETVGSISLLFDVAMDDIVHVNKMPDPSRIMVNQTLVIPLKYLWAGLITPTPESTASLTPTLASPTPTSAPTSQPTSVPVAIPAEVAAWPATVVELINQKRAANGLPPYSMSPELVSAAQWLADDCSTHGSCSHTGSDGSNIKTRLVRAGYNPAGFDWGENWVQAIDPVNAVEWWFNETPPNDPHRQNILHPRFTDIGVGIARADFGYYFIVDFGRR